MACQLSAEGSLIEAYRSVVNVVNERDARLTITPPDADKLQRDAAVEVAQAGWPRCRAA